MLLLTLALLLELYPSSDVPPSRNPAERITDEDFLASLAARAASTGSSFASFQALILTASLFDFSPLVVASGSTVEGTLPGPKCGITSSSFTLREVKMLIELNRQKKLMQNHIYVKNFT